MAGGEASRNLVVVGAGVVMAAMMEGRILVDLLRLTAATRPTVLVRLDQVGGQGSGRGLWPVLDLGMSWEGEVRAIDTARRIHGAADMVPVKGARRRLLPVSQRHPQAQDSVRQGADDRLLRYHGSHFVRLNHMCNVQMTRFAR